MAMLLHRLDDLPADVLDLLKAGLAEHDLIVLEAVGARSMSTTK